MSVLRAASSHTFCSFGDKHQPMIGWGGPTCACALSESRSPEDSVKHSQGANAALLARHSVWCATYCTRGISHSRHVPPRQRSCFQVTAVFQNRSVVAAALRECGAPLPETMRLSIAPQAPPSLPPKRTQEYRALLDAFNLKLLNGLGKDPSLELRLEHGPPGPAQQHKIMEQVDYEFCIGAPKSSN